jgi:biotin carboxyl carrier protein
VEGGNTRCFLVTVESADGSASSQAAAPAAVPAAPATAHQPAAAPTGREVPVYSTFAGSVELVDIKVKVGDAVESGQAVAAVEAMKATHDIKTPNAGTVVSILASIGDEIDNTKPILTIATKG